jgi:hypothetical protein
MTLWIDEFQFIKSRDDFFVTLDRAIEKTNDLLAKSPREPHLEPISLQLDAIKRWTANGREPTEDERKSTTIGVTIVREFDPAPTDEIAEWVDLVKEVEAYFEEWLDDARFQTVDVDDLDEFI